MFMNKNELVAFIANDADITKTDATKAVDSFVKAVGSALKKNDEVRLVGFGSFYISKRKATQGRNPRTGAAIKIPAAKLPKFRAGKSLKDTVA
jgi:DNA-binding protein HU-beta